MKVGLITIAGYPYQFRMYFTSHENKLYKSVLDEFVAKDNYSTIKKLQYLDNIMRLQYKFHLIKFDKCYPNLDRFGSL